MKCFVLVMGSRIRVANAPCSWGVVQGIEGESYDWRRVLDEITETGYGGSELGDRGFMPNDPALLRDELTRRTLAMIGAFTPVRLSDASNHAEAEAAAVPVFTMLMEILREHRG